MLKQSEKVPEATKTDDIMHFGLTSRLEYLTIIVMVRAINIVTHTINDSKNRHVRAPYGTEGFG